MLLWYVVALCFALCLLAYHFWQGITWPEALVLFLAASVVFAVHLHYIYKKTTTDEYLVTGYVTSKMYREPFSYQCGKHQCHEPPRWIIEQRPHPATRNVRETRYIHGGDAREMCEGECRMSYPAPYDGRDCCDGGDYAYSILVNSAKLSRTSIDDPSVALKDYFNPVRVSDDVIYDEAKDIPYFTVSDYNRAHRFVARGYTDDVDRKLEKLNSDLAYADISAAIIVTDDKMYFETLKRAWHQGKTNDFVVVVTSADGKTINNVNVLGWNNYSLKEDVADAVMALPGVDYNAIFDAVANALHKGQDFRAMDFKRYKFLSVKIPTNYYLRILAFQCAFVAYMLTLLVRNPNTKDFTLPWSDVGKMWEKHFRPPSPNWNLHPATPAGLFLYLGAPALAAVLMWSI